MSKFKLFGSITLALILIAVVFVGYALGHPEASFPWNNTITYILFGIYGVLTGLMGGLTFRSRKK